MEATWSTNRETSKRVGGGGTPTSGLKVGILVIPREGFSKKLGKVGKICQIGLKANPNS